MICCWYIEHFNNYVYIVISIHQINLIIMTPVLYNRHVILTRFAHYNWYTVYNTPEWEWLSLLLVLYYCSNITICVPLKSSSFVVCSPHTAHTYLCTCEWYLCSLYFAMFAWVLSLRRFTDTSWLTLHSPY